MIFLPKPPVFTPTPARALDPRFAQDLCLLLTLGEAGGSSVRSFDGLNIGTYHGTTLAWRSSPWGPAAVMDGSTNWIEVPASTTFNDRGINTTGSFSVLANFLWNSDAEAYGLVYGEEDGGGFNLAMFIESTGALAVYYQNTQTDPIPSFTLSAGWHQYVWTNGFDGGTRVYIDGKRIYQANNFGSGVAGTSARRARIFGNSIFGSGRYINGAVARIGKWFRQLTDAEIQELWSNPQALYLPLRRLWSPGSGGPPVQTITGSAGIPSEEAFGAGGSIALEGVQNLIGSAGIPSEETFGAGGALVVTPGIVGTTGIPSEEAFGAGGVVGVGLGLVGQYGIPSEEAFGQGALLLRNFTVFLGGVDITNLLIAVAYGSGAPEGLASGQVLTINDTLTGPTTAACTIRDPTGTLAPVVGEEFLFYYKGVRIFGGQVEEVIKSAFQARPDYNINLKLTDFSISLDRRVVGNFYQFGSMETVVADIVQNWLTGEGIVYDPEDGDPGAAITPLTLNWILVRDAFNQLSSMTGWEFKVDPNKILRFFDPTVGDGAAPFGIVDNDGHVYAESMTARTYRGKYANRIFVVSNAQGIPLWCDTFSVAIPGPFPQSPQPPDGVRTGFITLYDITALPKVTLNGNPQIVKTLTEIAGHVADGKFVYDWYWVDPNGAGVFQNPTQPPITASDTLVVCYPSQVPPVIFVQDDAQIAARAAIEGGSGIYDAVFQAKDITDPTALKTYAQGLLQRYGSRGMPLEVVFTTKTDGLKAGQLIRIHTSNPVVPDAFYLITSVVTTDVDKTFLKYHVTCTSGANQRDWTAFFAAINRAGAIPAPSAIEQHTWYLGPTVPGVVNPGVQGGIQAQAQPVQVASGLLRSVQVVFLRPPQIEGWGIQVLVNGNGTLSDPSTPSATPVFPPGFPASMTYFFQTATRVFAGDILQILLQRSIVASPGTDCTITVTIDRSL